jgi:hypothetical protein
MNANVGLQFFEELSASNGTDFAEKARAEV